MSNAPKNHPGPPLIAIVGAGACGVATAVRLLGSPVAIPRRVLLIDSAPRPGRGVAYRTENNAHLLNVPAGRMSPIPGEPGHFLDWLRIRVPDATGASFVPRRLFGSYLEELLTGTAVASDRAQFEMHVGRVTSMDPREHGVNLVLADGSSIRADRVVLATGHLPPAIPRGIGANVVSDRRFVADPWEPGWSTRVSREAPVLLLGSGLTMIDAVLELRGAGHTGPLRAISRHGHVPESHRGLPREPGRLPPPTSLASAQPAIAAYFRAVRTAVREAEDSGGDWHDVIGSLRPVTPDLWRRLPPAERARFLRHVRALWDAHRHRAAPEVALRIAVLRAKRTLRIDAARVVSISAGDDGLTAQLSLRGGGEEALTVGAVINCTGPDTNLDRAGDSLMRSLLESGRIRQDPDRLGIETGPNGEVIGRDGLAAKAMYYVGPMLRAGWWEATAMPELAGHAVRTADAILASVNGEQ